MQKYKKLMIFLFIETQFNKLNSAKKIRILTNNPDKKLPGL